MTDLPDYHPEDEAKAIADNRAFGLMLLVSAVFCVVFVGWALVAAVKTVVAWFGAFGA